MIGSACLASFKLSVCLFSASLFSAAAIRLFSKAVMGLVRVVGSSTDFSTIFSTIFSDAFCFASFFSAAAIRLFSNMVIGTGGVDSIAAGGAVCSSAFSNSFFISSFSFLFLSKFVMGAIISGVSSTSSAFGEVSRLYSPGFVMVLGTPPIVLYAT